MPSMTKSTKRINNNSSIHNYNNSNRVENDLNHVLQANILCKPSRNERP
jgi:hypothetical protein